LENFMTFIKSEKAREDIAITNLSPNFTVTINVLITTETYFVLTAKKI